MLLMWPTLWAVDRHAWRTRRAAGHHLRAGHHPHAPAYCAINDWADREFDGAVKRTAMRPLAAGEISGREALWWARVCAFQSLRCC